MTQPKPWDHDTPETFQEIETWSDLVAALHSEQMVPTKPEQGGHRRSSYLFRGMSNAAWPLQTSLERLGTEPGRVEKPALRSFAKYVPVGTVSIDSEWDRLALAQHNGLPTRVLDWTVSPFIAAHFATVEKEYRTGKDATDGVIWCVDADMLRDRLLPEGTARLLLEHSAYVFSASILDSLWPRLSDFDASEAEMIFLEPPSIDSRIQNQFGILSVMNAPDASHDAYLQRQSRSHPGLVRRVVIKREAKAVIRDMLDQNNITERMLFPGLPGLCDWLRRYYGPA